MPKVKPYVPPPNMARELIDRTMKANHVSSRQLAAKLHLQPESVRRKKCRGIWSVEEFRNWCLALGIEDPEEIGLAVLNRTRR